MLGVDPSLSGLALCLLRGDGLHFSNTLSSKPPTVKSLRNRMARYGFLADRVLEWMGDKRWPRLILLEGYSYGSKGSSVLSLAEFGAVLRLKLMSSALSHGSVVVEVPPSVLKKFATGKGNANKTLVVSSLSKRYGLNFQDDNQADAYGLARLGLVVLGLKGPENQAQESSAEVVRSALKVEGL